jgi:hypothetical protein
MLKHSRPAIFALLFVLASFIPGGAKAPPNTEAEASFWKPLPATLSQPSPAPAAPAAFGATSTETYEIIKQPTYERPYSLRVADLNQDGWNDVVISTEDQTVRVWLQNPQCHQLQEWHNVHQGMVAMDLEVADLNGDGKMEMITAGLSHYGAEGPGKIQILSLTESGYTASDTVYEVGSRPTRVRVGDVNHDGRPDILVTTNNVLDVLVQQADGTFAPLSVTSPPLPDHAYVNDVVVGHFNQDNRLDVAVQLINLHESIVVYYQTDNGLAPGTLLPWPYSSDTHWYADYMTAGDLTGDGRVDIAAVVSKNVPYSKVVVYRQLAGGGFAPPVGYGTFELPVSPQVIDMDGDGRQDLVMMNNGYNTFTVHYQLEDGTLGEAVQRDAGNRFGDVQVLFPFQRISAFGDVTGDGKNDVVYISTHAGLVLVAQGTPPTCPVNLPPRARVPFLLYGVITGMDGTDIAGGDVNGDELVDVLLLDHNQVKIVYQTPNGGFKTGPMVSFGEQMLSSISVGDLNGDGRLDIAAANGHEWGGLFVAYQGSGGQFLPPLEIYNEPHPWNIFIADWNGDGKDDLAALAENGIKVYEQTADGSLSAVRIYAGGEIGASIYSQMVDWNADGWQDLVVWWRPLSGYSEKPARVFLQQEDGSFELLASQWASVPGGMDTGDLNQDGIPDLLFSHSGMRLSARLSLFYQQPGGGLSPRSLLSDLEFGLPGAAAIADMNFDGLNDIMIQNTGGNPMTIFTQNAQGTFDPPVYYPSTNWNRTSQNAVRIDADQDGSPEIFVYATQDNYLLFIKTVPYYETFIPLAERQ